MKSIVGLVFILLLFLKIGEIIACLWADKKDLAERENIMLERGGKLLVYGL